MPNTIQSFWIALLISATKSRCLSPSAVTDGSGRVPVGFFEHCIEFVVVEENTGKNLLDVLLAQLTELGLDFNDIRGQGYDNGANMKGHTLGVQARLLDMNPKVFSLPVHAIVIIYCWVI